MELEGKLYDNITALTNKAEGLIDENKPTEAIKFFFKAFELVPNPKTDWEASTWILAAIGDTYFDLEEFELANKYLKHTEIYPNGVESDFILLKIGQSYFELGNIEKAKEYLLRAYLISGEKIFDEEDSKYFNLIRDLIKRNC